MTKTDAVDNEFYIPLRRAERVSEWAFYAAAILSILVLQIDAQSQKSIYATAQVAFVFSVLVVFISGFLTKLYWASRAHHARIADFLSHAFNVKIVPTISDGYYSNDADGAVARVAASTLENALFSKTIVRKMLLWERVRVFIYASIWIIAVIYRETEIGLITTAAQVVFSEQMLSRWLRMEWLRMQAESIHNDLYSLLGSGLDRNADAFRARSMQALLRYETSKAIAGISLSTAIFQTINDDTSTKWADIKRDLQLK